MKPFQAVVLAIFVSLALLGVFIFATFSASGGKDIGTVVIWGAMPQDTFDKLLSNARAGRNDFNGVTYKEVPQELLMPQLVTAIAAGTGPDLVLFPASSFVEDGNKLQPMPYSIVSKRDFQDTFVQSGEIFLTDDGVAALPFTIDPLVLYWNRTLFGNAGIARPPKYWDDVASLAPKLTQKADNGSLAVSAIALGGWGNISHAKGILLTLMTQLGSPVVTKENGVYRSVLTAANSDGVSVADSAVRFYTDFADPVKPAYSWNRSQKNSRDAFLAGTLAMYIAPASELLQVRDANPNLNFDVAPVPMVRGGGQQVSAAVDGVAIPRGAKNATGAQIVALELASSAEQEFLINEIRLPSPRRDVEADASSDAYLSTFRAAALNSFSFNDPNPTETEVLFGRMIDTVQSGKAGLSDAVRNADDELQVLLRAQ